MAEPATLPPRPRTPRRRWTASFVGPLFFYDLVRLARRGRSTLLRCVYALTLFASLYVAYHNRFPAHDLLSEPFTAHRAVRPAELSRLAGEFVASILWLQTAAIFVLTPAYLAGALAEEKERGTLELLFTTHLLDREIVLGKLAARLVHLAGVLIAGVPLLVLTQLWGGVDIHLLTAAFVVSAFNLMSVGAISIFCSVACPTVTTGMLTSYLLAGVLFFISSVCPFGAMTNAAGLFELLAEQPVDSSSPPGLTPVGVAAVMPRVPLAVALGLAVLLHGSVAFFFAVSAVGNLRPAAGVHSGDTPVRPAPPPPRAFAPAPRAPPESKPAGFGYVELPSAEAERPAERRAADWRPTDRLPDDWQRPERRPAEPAPPKPGGWGPFDAPAPRPSVLLNSRAAVPNLPPVGNWPLLWKESLHRRGLDSPNERAVWPALVAIPVAFALLALLAPEAARERWVGLLGSLPQLAVLLSAGVWGVVVAFRAVAGISKERDNGTLEGLLTLPVSRATILGAKWLGPFVYARAFGWVTGLVIVTETAAGMIHPDAAVMLTLAIAAHLAFLASLGVWLSLASRNTLWARVSMALVLLVFLGIGVRFLSSPMAAARMYAIGAADPGPPVRLSSIGPPPVAPRPWDKLPWGEYAVEVGLSVPGNWWFLTMPRHAYAKALANADSEFAAQLILAAGSIAGYGLAARLLWSLACLRFRGEQRR